jgi:GH35 family endo-1,4-beta-xylanase
MEKGAIIFIDASAHEPIASLDKFMTMDMKYNPFPSLFYGTSTGQVACRPKTDKPFAFAVRRHIPEFGDLVVYADSEGKGYAALPPGEATYLVLAIELAKTRAYHVSSRVHQLQREGYKLPKKIGSKIDEARSSLKKAESEGSRVGFNDAGRKALSECVRLSDKALSLMMWTGEELELQKARSDIEKRKGEAAITNLRAGSKNYLFGCNAFGLLSLEGDMLRQYEERFAAVFSYATLPFYWRTFEWEKGKPTWKLLDSIVERLSPHGITMKGHPLIWFHQGVVPPWLTEMDYDGVKGVVRRRVYDIVKRYKGKIDIWDIINEAHDYANCFRYTHEQLMEILNTGIEAARKANPNATLIVNNMDPWANYAARGVDSNGPVEGRRLQTPLQYIRMLEEHQVDYDAIGLQIYYPARDMTEISRLIDSFSQFGKPIHITELGVPSKYEDDPKSVLQKNGINIKSMGYWHKPWDEQTQADWVEQFYTICFSKPSVEAVTWWDLSDCVPHFWPHGGFLRTDMTPKKSYHRLKALIASWR